MIGKQVAHYSILEKLGEGGMGVVYKARDTHLDRFLAVKVLPHDKVADQERKRRFVQEAKSASALNHPSIVHIYDISEAGGIDYIAMEYVAGKTLGELIGRKGLKLADALHHAIQIADALAKAHAAGIVHRDLKPSNIMVTPDGLVKVLDFGLAKLTEAVTGEDETTQTLRPATEEGTIVGTAAYMSPEQAEGKPVDARSDIFSFGSVLYEMLTGQRAFSGDSKMSTLSAVLHKEPEPLPAEIPRELARIVTRCLRKEPSKRFQHIADVKVALAELKEESESGKLAPAAPTAARRRRWLWAAGFATLAILAAFGAYRWLAPRPAAPFERMQITRLTDSGKASAAAISPDGKYVVHAVTDEGKSSLWMRHAATGSNVQILPPVEGSFSDLNFSRDGSFLYYMFFTGTPPPALYAMPVLGGNARKLASFPGIAGASLSPDEKRLAFIRTAGGDSGLFIVNLDDSGERKLAVHKFPEQVGSSAWSPDGKVIATSVLSLRGGISMSLAAIPVEGGPEQRIGSRTWYGISSLRWLPDSHGLIVIASEQLGLPQVWHVSYPGGDARRITNDLNNYSGLSLTGDASALVTVQSESSSRIWLVSIGDAASAREITTGRRDGMIGLAWTGDGNIVFGAHDSSRNNHLWLTAADRTPPRQLTTGSFQNYSPAVCGDGRHLVFLSYRAGTPHIWRSDLDGGNARQLTSGDGEFGPSCSPDGTWLTFGTLAPNSFGVWRMPIDGGAPARIWDRYGFSEISPDGKMVLIREYYDDQPKVRIIPATGGQPTRTFDPNTELGGSLPRWSADGASLLYVKTSGGVSNVWRRPLDGSDPKQVTSFTSDQIGYFAVSRDGKKLALARGATTSDVVLIRDLK